MDQVKRDLGNSETSYQLPRGWEWTTLRAITDTTSDRRDPQKNPTLRFIGLNHITSRAMQIEGSIPASDRKGMGEYFSAGDILYSRLLPQLNRVARPDFDGLCSTDFTIFRQFDAIDIRYIQYLLFSQEFVEFATTFTKGGIQRVAIEHLLSYKLRLPPRAEQTRIVERLEKLFSLVDASVNGLNRINTNFGQYKLSILKAAFEGKLTAPKLDDEPVKDLIERTLNERENRRLAYYPLRRNQNSFSIDDTKDLSSLPKSWQWSTLGYLFDIYIGGTPKRNVHKYWDKGDVPWVSSGEVAFCYIGRTKEKITSSGLNSTSAKIHPVGTILLGLVGEGKTRGQAAILDIVASHNQNSAAIRVSETDIIPQYIYYFLLFNYEQTRQLGEGSTHTALNKSRVERIAFPLAPKEEMLRIVQKIEQYLSVIDELSKSTDLSLQKAHKLQQAVIKTALEGTLIPQNESDEAASEVISYIEEQRARSKSFRKQTHISLEEAMPARLIEMNKSMLTRPLRKLQDILQEAKRLTPEQLLTSSGRTIEDIEGFYRELRDEIHTGHIVQKWYGDNAYLELNDENS